MCLFARKKVQDKMDCNSRGLVLHRKQYSFCNVNVEKSQALSSASGSRHHSCWQPLTCALIPHEKAAKIPAGARQIHKPVSPFSLQPHPCSIWVLVLPSLLFQVESKKHFFVFLCLFTLTAILFSWVPLASGEIFYKAWLPLEHHKSIPRRALRPRCPLLPTVCCTGYRRSQIPVENYFSFIQERCVRKMVSL